MSKDKYLKENVIKDVREALSGTEAGEANKPTKPNVIKELMAKTRLGKGKQ